MHLVHFRKLTIINILCKELVYVGICFCATPAKTRSQTVQGSISEVISTQLSMSQSDSDNNKSRSKTSVITSATGATGATGPASHKPRQRSQAASGSESSIPEEVPSASSEEKKKVGIKLK